MAAASNVLVTIESTSALMKHRDVSVILATGGGGLVRAAYSSGKPAYGVGPGNVPVYVDRSADVRAAAEAIVSSQCFDNATLCCSEQALVLDEPVAETLLAEMAARGAHLCSDAERALLEFETITLAPIDRALIAPELMTSDEIAWLDSYHARVRETLTPLVDDETASWLADVTRPLAS